MHYTHRNLRDERRSPGSSRRNLDDRDEFNRKKEVVFKQAGKLAAEYLVSIGMFPKSSLRPKREENGRFDQFRRRERNYRRNGDDDGCTDRRRKRGRKGEYGSDWGRERREERRWRGRDRGDDDFRHKNRRMFCDRWSRSIHADGLGLEHRNGFHRFGLTNVPGGECPVENVENRDDEVMSYESGEVREGDFGVKTFEVEGGVENGVGLLELCRFAGVPTKPRTKRGRGKGSLSNGRKLLSEYTIDLNKALSDVSLESDGEAKIEISGNLKGISLPKEVDVARSCRISKDDCDLLKLCSFKNVPTKSRTSFGRRRPRIAELLATRAKKMVENGSEVPKVIEGVDIMVDFASDSLLDQSNILEGKEFSPSSITFSQKVNGQEDIMLLGQPLKLQLIEGLLMVEEVVTGRAIDQVKSVNDDSSQKVEPELNIKMEVEKQLQPTLFEVCDPNLSAPPEIPLKTIEVLDDLVLDQHTSVPIFEAALRF